MKGVFETKSLISAFTGPLSSLSRVTEEGGITLHVSKADKTINIYALNQPAAIMTNIVYKDLFTNFEINEDEKVGILSIPKFIDFFDILDSDKVEINYDSKLNSFSLDGGALGNGVFKTADTDLIKDSPKSFKGYAWVASVEVDPNFAAFRRSLSKLGDEDCVMIVGDKAKGVITFTTRSSSVEINKFVFNVTTKVDADFSTFYSKKIFQDVISTPSEKMTISFADRLIKVESNSKHADIIYYVAKKAAK